MLSKVKDAIAQKNGYADWLQIDMTDQESCEREEFKASLIDEIAEEYATLRSQQLEDLLKEKGIALNEAERKAAKYKQEAQQLEETMEKIKAKIDYIGDYITIDICNIIDKALHNYRNNLK